MKGKLVKVLSLGLCGILTLGVAGMPASARNIQAVRPEPDTAVTATAAADAAAAPKKNETVYVLSEADGSVRKIIVNDWLQNEAGLSELSDASELSDVENVKSDVQPQSAEDGSLVWSADGGDITYQGTIEKELPVTLKVTYTLDGQEMTPEEMAGQSGHAVIRFSYENNQTAEVELNGKTEQFYVPFVVMSAAVLPGDVFSDITVKNGKAISDGARTVAAGIAFPGLQEDLGVDAEDFEVPSYVEIEADVKDFAMGMTLTAVVPANLEAVSDDMPAMDELTDSLGKLTEAMDQLTDGSAQLLAGLETLLGSTGELADGVKQVNDGAGQVAEGTHSVRDGAAKVSDGAAQVSAGAGQVSAGAGQVSAGANSLAAGLSQLSGNSAALNAGASQVFDALLATAQTQLTEKGLPVPALTKDNYGAVLDQLIASLDEKNVYAQAQAQVTAAVEEKRGYITEQVTAAVQEQVKAKVTEAVKAEVQTQVEEAVKAEVNAKVTEAVKAGVRAQVIQTAAQMSAEDYENACAAGLIGEDVQAQINAAVEAQMGTPEVQAMIASKTDEQMQGAEAQAALAANTEAQMASETVQGIIAAKTDEQMQSAEVQGLISQNTEAQVQKAITDNMASPEVQASMASASEGAKQIIGLKTSLDSYRTFYNGLQTYTAGVDAASAGATTLAGGAASLADGAGTLATGAASLADGSKTLATGTTDLAAGADALAEGTGKLNDSMPALTSGVTQLRDGAKALNDGLNTFNQEGIQKLVDAVDGDLMGLLDRVRAAASLAKDYRSFSGIADGYDGEVKFLYRTDEVNQ